MGVKGYIFKSKTGNDDGIVKASLRAGDAGKPKLQLAAKGASLRLPLPASGTKFFEIDSAFIVQLYNSEGHCWSSTFTATGTSKNDGEKVKAKAP